MKHKLALNATLIRLAL